VVGGRSAGPLLDGVAPGGSRGASSRAAGVQHDKGKKDDKKDDKEKPAKKEKKSDGLPIPEGAITADQLGGAGSKDATAFKRNVFKKQQQWAIANKAYYGTGLPGDQLDDVEDGQQMRKDAAAKCVALLAKARSELATQKGDKTHKNHKHAKKVDSIGVRSGYRSPRGDQTAWENTFDTVMTNTKDTRAAMKGGELGNEALNYMVEQLIPIKAIPGFSNHTNGIAMDFGTVEEGLGDLGPRTSQKEKWQKSWFYKWLTDHAPGDDWVQLPSEEWHWDYKPKGDAPPAGPDDHK
jgi:hypothetical protein